MSESSLTQAKDVATIIGVVVAVVTLLKALFEYNRTTVLRRIEYYAKMKDEFLKDPTFTKLTELLETDNPELGNISATDKWRYLCFFEEVALLLRAGLIHDKVACYMFGYYALKCDESQWFWSGSFPKDETYWLLFFDFVKHMEVVRRSKVRDPKAFVARMRP